MEFLAEYGLFLAQAFTIVAAFLLAAGGVVALGQRQRDQEGHIEIRKLNERYEGFSSALRRAVLPPGERKREEHAEKRKEKAERRREKAAAKAAKKAARESERGSGAGEGGDSPAAAENAAGGEGADSPARGAGGASGEGAENPASGDAADRGQGARKRLYVLNFHGDLRAGATEDLREEISAVLSVARGSDAVLVRLESGGGMVHAYGLAASQLRRVRDADIPLTVAVDKIAASGGYMMACVADRVLAAPFAVIGSIGVLAQLPNFHRLLRKASVDFEQLTAGEYKRTLSLFGENTEAGRAKMQEDIEDAHLLFKDFVSRHRNGLDINAVATGEIWYGERALERGLVDEVQTSDSFIQSRLKETDIFEVRHVRKRSWQEKLGLAAEGALERAFLKLWQAAVKGRRF